MKIKFKKFSSRVTDPSLATLGSACYDIFSAEEKIIPPCTVSRVKTDIGFKIHGGYFGKIHSRSSRARRFTGVGGGVNDSDYRGSIDVIFFNYSDNWLQIHREDKFAQIAIQKKANNVKVEEVLEFHDKTERGTGGFGSTDKKYRLKVKN